MFSFFTKLYASSHISYKCQQNKKLLVVPGMFWEGPPETGAKSSRQEAEPEGREQPSRESSPIKGSVVQRGAAPGKHMKTLNHVKMPTT